MRRGRLLLLVLMVCVLTGITVGCGTRSPEAQGTPVLAPVITQDLGDKVTMRLVLIRPGEFSMGGGRYNERPVRLVQVTRAFYMGATEVTQAQFLAVMGHNPSTFDDDLQRPVENVSWVEAQAFCGKLSAVTGRSIRLPTEAEWEYACRAGSTAAYCFGDNLAELDDYAWSLRNSKRRSWPVGQKKPNAWGLYDMHGNVWEWCADWYAPTYANQDTVDPVGPSSGTYRSWRGGTFAGEPGLSRSAYRHYEAPGYHCDSLGFRVVMDLPVEGRQVKKASRVRLSGWLWAPSRSAMAACSRRLVCPMN